MGDFFIGVGGGCGESWEFRENRKNRENRENREFREFPIVPIVSSTTPITAEQTMRLLTKQSGTTEQ